MKYLICLLLVLSAVFLSCKKDKNHAAWLTGTWLQVSETGGFAGLHTKYAPGTGHITCVFNADKTCTRTIDTTVFSSSYRIDGDKIILAADGSAIRFLFVGDTLILDVPGLVDGVADGFVRQK